MSPRVALVCLGCAKNLVDAEITMGELRRRGYELTADETRADVVIIQTCAFIDAAREEATEVINEIAAKIKPDATLAVTGCWAQREGAALRRLFPRVDVVVGVGPEDRLARALAGEVGPVQVAAPSPPFPRVAARCRLTAPHVAYIKIADGCDHGCTFCVIPRLRGRYRSRPAEDVIAEAEAAVGGGAREIVLLAQDSTGYGRDRGEAAALPRLLRRLGDSGAAWVRLLYLFPGVFDEELMAAFAETRNLVPYFDLPLQHASPRLLKAMGRPAYPPDEVLARVEGLRRALPAAALRTTFIVGFPGETPQDVDLLVDFVQESRFDHVGVFEFSPQEGTPAAALPGRPSPAEAACRKEAVMLSQQLVVAAKYRELIGRTLDFLVDAVMPEGRAMGRAYFQAPEQDTVSLVDGVENVRPGDFVRAAVRGHAGYDLLADGGRAVGEAGV